MKKLLCASILMIVALGLPASSQQQRAGTTKWEYLIAVCTPPVVIVNAKPWTCFLNVAVNVSGIEGITTKLSGETSLDQIGIWGWELVSTLPAPKLLPKIQRVQLHVKAY